MARRLLYRYAKPERTKLRDGGCPWHEQSRSDRSHQQSTRLLVSIARRGTRHSEQAARVGRPVHSSNPPFRNHREEGKGDGGPGEGNLGPDGPFPRCSAIDLVLLADVAKHGVVADNYPLRARNARRRLRRAALHNMGMRRSERLITNGSGSRTQRWRTIADDERTIGWRGYSERTSNDPCSASVRRARCRERPDERGAVHYKLLPSSR